MRDGLSAWFHRKVILKNSVSLFDTIIFVHRFSLKEIAQKTLGSLICKPAKGLTRTDVSQIINELIYRTSIMREARPA